MSTETITVTAPDTVDVKVNGKMIKVKIPQNVKPGQKFQVQVPSGLCDARSPRRAARPSSRSHALPESKSVPSEGNGICPDPEAEKKALEKDPRSNRNSKFLTWVHGASWDPDLADQPKTQVSPASKKHLPWAFIRVPKIPTSVDEFVALRDVYGKDAGPETAAALFVVAMVVFTRDENVGKQCFVVVSDKSWLRDARNPSTPGVYKGKRVWGTVIEGLMRRLKQYPFIATSLFFGTTRDDGYDLSKLDRLLIKVKDCNAAETKGDNCNRHAWCPAAKMPRGMTLHRNTAGVWKVKNAAGMVTAPPFPKVTDDGDDI